MKENQAQTLQQQQQQHRTDDDKEEDEDGSVWISRISPHEHHHHHHHRQCTSRLAKERSYLNQDSGFKTNLLFSGGNVSRLNKRGRWKGFRSVNILVSIIISLVLSTSIPSFVQANLGSELESCTVENGAVVGASQHQHSQMHHHHHSSSPSGGSSSSSSSSSSGSANNNGNNLQSQKTLSSQNGIGSSSSGGNGNGGGGGGGSGSSGGGSSSDGHLWGGETVLCQIRTLHSELDFENLTSSVPIVDMGVVTKLRLVCNDVLFFESLLEAGQLSSFSALHELSIEKCKLKYLPSESLQGLKHLRKLTILTGNSDWASRSLELSPSVLHDVPQVRHLNLGFNHMWNLPDQLLCQVGFLQTLNLTHNLLSDIDDLGLPPPPPQQPPSSSSQQSTQSKLHQQLSLKFGSNSNIASSISRGSSSDSSSSSGGGSSSSSSSCLAELKSFDLSYNTLRSLGRGRLEKMRRLQDLRLDHNWLEELSDEAFVGLSSLRTLNLSSNRLVALPTKLFQPTKLLRELDLRNNSLTTLPAQLLDPLEHLQILDVSMNTLSLSLTTSPATATSTTVEAFKGLVRLIILNLSHNQITSLSPSTFKDLYTLQVLDLSYNQISSIQPQTFMTLSNLHALNLAKNHLASISAHTFDGLYVLHKLILDYNEISGMDAGSLKNCTSLQDLGLVGNQLNQVPSALRSLPLLRTLDLGENRISILSNTSFTGLGQLYGLRLVDNQLETLPKGLCDPISRLRVFNVAQNRIKTLSPSAFTTCPDLRVLRLDSNQLTELPPSLAGQLPSLLWLNVSENQLAKVDYSLLPSTLEWLDVSHNQLVSLGGIARPAAGLGAGGGGGGSGGAGASVRSNYHPHINGKIRLRVIDASHNLLTSLDHHVVPSSLEVLRLNYNNLARMAPDTLNRANNLRRVELIGNQLTTVPLTAIRFPPVPHGRPLPEFLLGGNPFLCDCEMEWLTRIHHLAALRSHPIILDLDTVVCRLAYSRSSSHVALPEMKPQDFLCPYKSHCFALCHCCEFDACDCAMTCPANCTCYHDDTWSANVVDCAGSAQPAIPPRLPMDSTEVYLDGNSIPLLKSHTFIGRKNLRVLYLNSSRIETISNKSFNGLQSLQTLHLEENHLMSLHGFEFDHLSRLRELFLHNNRIRTISNNTFLPLKSLEILRIDGNQLITYSVWQLSLNPYLVDIGLSRNPWDCDCDYLHHLHSWVKDNSKKILDLSQVRCSWNKSRAVGHLVLDYKNNTCGPSSAWASLQDSFGQTFGNIDFLSLVLGLVFFLIFLLLLVVLLVLCREGIKLWFFSHFGLRLGSCWGSGHFCFCPCPCFCSSLKGMKERDEEKSYDAYLIYSQKDEEFVTDKIADELETNDNYRLCLHHRDLVNETGDLKGMMWGAVDSAKSIIVILSKNFLQGEWSVGESYTAFHSVMNRVESGGLSTGKGSSKTILYVLTEAIPVEELMSSEFRTIFSWRKIKKRTLEWSSSSSSPGGDEEGDKKFWSRLKFLLPDPSSHYHSNITSNTTTTSAASSSADTPAKYVSQTQAHHNHHHHISSPIMSGNHQGHCPEPSPMMMIINGGHNGLPPNHKLWPSPYSPANFVAMPPQYQQHQQSQQNQQQQISHRTQSSLPKCQSPPSNSTDSTTLDHDHIMDDGGSGSGSGSGGSSFYGHHSHHGTGNSNSTSNHHHLNHSNLSKSPLPAVKSHGRNNGSAGTATGSSSKYHQYQSQTSNHNNHHGHGGGESYLSLEGEHVYSSLDPPSPQQSYHPGLQIQLGSNYSSSLVNGPTGGHGSNSGGNNSNGTGNPNNSPTSSNSAPSGMASMNLKNIHLPNGYTYSPSPRPQPQWHPHPSNPPTMTGMGVPTGHHAPLPPHSLHSIGIGKGRKTSSKNPSENVQTYLV